MWPVLWMVDLGERKSVGFLSLGLEVSAGVDR
jgi:hypothetical protein